MSETISIVLASLTSSGFMSLVLYFIQRKEKNKDKEEAKESAQSKMLLGLAHDRILHITKDIIRRGAITTREKSNLRYLYLPYKALGGNGDCEIAYETCQKLEVVSEEYATELELNYRYKEFNFVSEDAKSDVREYNGTYNQ